MSSDENPATRPRFPSDAFVGTATYYARFRPPYPRALIRDLLDRSGATGQGRAKPEGVTEPAPEPIPKVKTNLHPRFDSEFRRILRRSFLPLCAGSSLLLSGCVHRTVVEAAPAQPPTVIVEHEQNNPAPAVVVHEAPPPPREETPPPPPSSDQTWIAGHWEYRDGNYSWVPGHYAMPPQPTTTWVAGHWETQDGGYVYVPGYWSQQ